MTPSKMREEVRRAAKQDKSSNALKILVPVLDELISRIEIVPQSNAEISQTLRPGSRDVPMNRRLGVCFDGYSADDCPYGRSCSGWNGATK